MWKKDDCYNLLMLMYVVFQSIHVLTFKTLISWHYNLQELLSKK